MRLSTEEIDHIALLARLELEPEERETVARDLTRILEYFETLERLDTRGVEPMAHVLPLQNVLRTDTVRPGLSLEAALQNAPEAVEGLFQVPRVVEAD
jgi:aspartyl-tRNA(Asn)/glutamyl-tRNA(Gln) amidotransferase subunit C